MKESVGKCNICRDTYTKTYAPVAKGSVIYVCDDCTEKAKDNFIWLCKHCGKSYLRLKQLVIYRVKDHELKKAYMICEDKQIIQRIDTCISCDPEKMLKFMEAQHVAMEC